MLDMIAYRQYETIARAALPNWQIAQRHNLDHFEKTGFPVRLTTLAETRQLFDTMQEHGFAKYQEDFGGLSEADFTTLVETCAALINFQLVHYPEQTPLVPVDTALAALCSWKYITGLQPNLRSVLEIGPGCGFLSLFASRFQQLDNYSTVECCESFYLLQHYINIFAFGQEFSQMAFPPRTANYYIRPDDDLVDSFTLAEGLRPRRRAFQYPWWRLRTLRQTEEKFDVIVSNSNLLEFNAEALQDYLELFKEKVADNGIIFVQGFGFETPEKNKGYLFKRLYERGIAPMFVTLGSLSKDRTFWAGTTQGDCSFITEGDVRTFGSDFAVLITERHERFAECYDMAHYKNAFSVDDPRLGCFFSPPPADAKQYSKKDIVKAACELVMQQG
ncbi:hypothetical protein [Desulfovibrio inopinatus]|uniref:hypothetical protein n=1 Tax=Desulfovibrio inopinatus TaxID=102109 RepID=UPI0003F4D3A2|nr:hypothetical protein [Desulfovibrio inopinatus]